MPLAKTDSYCISGSETAVKAKKDLFPRRTSHLISLGQFAHNNNTFEDQKPQELGKPLGLGRSPHQLTKSEAIRQNLTLSAEHSQLTGKSGQRNLFPH